MRTDLIFQAVEMGKALPSEFAAEIFPDPFGWVQFWARGSEKDECDVVWDAEAFGGMCAALIHQHDIERFGMGCRKQIEKDLHIHRIKMGQKEEEPLTALCRHRTIEPTVRILMLSLEDGFDPVQRDATAQNRHEPPAAFILRPDLYGSGGGGRDGGTDPLDNLSLERFNGIRFFSRLLRRATFGRALSL